MGKDKTERTANWVVNIVVLIGLGFVYWSLFVKRTEQENFTRGASKQETSFEIHEYPLSFGCSRWDLRDSNVRPQVIKKKE